ncbi:putative F-box protein PP2-B12 [Cajanus cajan]|uniref:putative F-box protein PP2-B12 n=1 Tax=Cajanus cajan TaxID=3821 RepID=UPI0010FBAEE0|nr:putative F-box protein PP2-B12 [Cajanus cajan]
MIENGKDLVCNCSKVHRLNCLSRARYQGELAGLSDSVSKLTKILFKAYSVREQMMMHKHNMLNSALPLHESSYSNPQPYMLVARTLFIAWGDDPSYWTWTSHPDDRDSEVAELVSVCWLEIRGWIKTSMLPRNTYYGAYFVFKQKSDETYGFKNQAIEVSVKVGGEGDGDGDGKKKTVYLEGETPPRARPHGLLNRVRSRLVENYDAPKPKKNNPSGLAEVEYPKERSDGWMEVELGEFFSGHGKAKEVDMGVYETKDLHWKKGILVQGIEIRAKPNSNN